MNFARASFADAFAPCERLPTVLYADLDASREGFEFRRKRDDLIEAIHNLHAYAADRGYGQTSSARLRVAVDFVREIPADRALPRVAVDEDGDVLMAWEGLALTFEGRVLHMVVDPGSNSNHVDPTVYDGGLIPQGIVGHIPRRA